MFSHKVFVPVLVGTQQLESVSDRLGDSFSFSITGSDGFRQASCIVGGNRNYLETWMEERLGYHWRAEDRAGNIVWEGLVWSLALTDEGWEQSVSLGNLANRINVLYASIIGQRLRVGWADDLDSQTKYGIKEVIHTVGGGLGMVAARAAAYRDLQLSTSAWPGRSKKYTGAPGTSLRVGLKGYFSTLDWRIYNDVTGGTANSSAMVEKITVDPGVGVGQFINSVQADTNVLQFPDYHNRDRYAGSILRDLVSSGDGTNPWVLGVYESRVLRYEQLATEINALWAEGAPYPTNLSGAVLYPWLIRPNTVIQAPWLSKGRTLTNSLEDPTVLIVKEVSFTAPYAVSIVGTDDTRIQVALNQIQMGRW